MTTVVLSGLRCYANDRLTEALDLNLPLPFDEQICPRQAAGNLTPPWQFCTCWRNSNGARVSCCIRRKFD